jgi:hypothetical protein
MSACAYFQIIRPGRTFVITLISVGFAYFLLRTLSRAPSSEALFLILTLVGPIIVGTLLIGPLHEVMHRSFFPLLPDARRRFRRWLVWAIAVVSVLIFGIAAIFISEIPKIALYGLILAGLSLRLLSPRWHIRGKGLLRYLPALLLFLVLGITPYRAVVTVCQQTPWIVFVGGVGFAYACFHIGFAPWFVRNRWRDPNLFCIQSMVPFFGSDMPAYIQTLTRQLVQERSTRIGRDWSTSSIGSSLYSWVRVVHHARYGRVSRLRQLLGFAVAGAVIIPALSGYSYLMAKFSQPQTSLALFCRQILEAGKATGSIDHPQLIQLFTMAPTFAYTMPLIATIVACLPMCSLPISRQRLASCLFIDAHRTALFIFVVNVLGLILGFYAISLIAGVPFDVGTLRKPLAAYAILPPVITLNLGICFLQSFLWRSLASIGVFVITIMAVFTVEIKFAPHVLSPLGLLGCAVATGFAGWLSWLAFHRYYEACDLNHPGDWLRKLGFNIT